MICVHKHIKCESNVRYVHNSTLADEERKELFMSVVFWFYHNRLFRKVFKLSKNRSKII